MSIYRVNPVGFGGGFKAHVADDAGGIRVVGVFLTEADANVWIAADRNGAARSDDGGPSLFTGRDR
jgi:hypothetical protein